MWKKVKKSSKTLSIPCITYIIHNSQIEVVKKSESTFPLLFIIIVSLLLYIFNCKNFEFYLVKNYKMLIVIKCLIF